MDARARLLTSNPAYSAAASALVFFFFLHIPNRMVGGLLGVTRHSWAFLRRYGISIGGLPQTRVVYRIHQV